MGVRGANSKILKNTGKSGLTPITPGIFSDGQRYLQNYQKRRYYGFSAAELNAMEAMAALNTETMTSTLDNPVHPMYELSQWETYQQMGKHLGPIPIRGDHEGYWVVSFNHKLAIGFSLTLYKRQRTQSSGKS